MHFCEIWMEKYCYFGLFLKWGFRFERDMDRGRSDKREDPREIIRRRMKQSLSYSDSLISKGKI